MNTGINAIYTTGLLRVLREDKYSLPVSKINDTGLLHYLELKRDQANRYKDVTFVMPDGTRKAYEEL